MRSHILFGSVGAILTESTWMAARGRGCVKAFGGCRQHALLEKLHVGFYYEDRQYREKWEITTYGS